MINAFICDAIRTPFGRYGGALSAVRTDDLAAIPITALLERNPSVDWSAVDDVILGCANQAGEDNRNVARMALLLAGLPQTVPGSTINRLCGSSMDAVSIAARAIKTGENSLVIAGGVESMSRAPFVMGKADAAFSRQAKLEDTTIGWRFVNPLMKAQYGVRLDAGDRRKRGRRIQDFARGPGCIRLSKPAAGRRRHAERHSCRGDHPGHHHQGQRNASRGEPGRTSSSRHYVGSARGPEAHRQAQMARSQPAMPQASTTVRAGSCWLPRRP